MKLVRLTHVSNHPAASGKIGTVLRVSEQLASRWASTRGAVILSDAVVDTAESRHSYPEQAAEPLKRKRGRPKRVETNEQPVGGDSDIDHAEAAPTV
jgi:hypothetical protein